MTKDCPRGLRAFRQKLAKQYVLAASLVLTALGCAENDKVKKAFGLEKFEKPSVIMGDMAMPNPPPTSTMGMVGPAPVVTPSPAKPPIKMGEIAAPTAIMGRVAAPVPDPNKNCPPGSK